MGNKTDNPTYTVSFRERHALAVRLWHWLSYFTTTAIFTTVIMSYTVLSTSANSELIMQKLTGNGTVISKDQAKNLAHELNDKVWTTHKYIGYILATLFLVRIIAEFAVDSDEKLFTRLRKSLMLYKIGGPTKDHARHYLGVRLMYLGFYILFIIIITTGLSMAFGKDLGIPRPVTHAFHQVHEVCMYILLAFIAAHIAGVVTSEFGKNKGIVSDMINGGKNNTEEGVEKVNVEM